MSAIFKDYRTMIPSVVGGILSGRAIHHGNADTLPVINPDDGAHITEIGETDAAQIGDMVAAAKESFDDGTWSRSPHTKRVAVLKQAAHLVRENADDLAALDSLTTGLLFHRSLKHQALAAAGWFEYFADMLANAADEHFATFPDTDTRISREPAGVAALFTPWNIPIMGASLKLAAALAMGNSCILKPSEQSPLGAMKLVELLYAAGIPKGALHLANGRGAVTGDALASHKDVARISFTGGENAGRIIAQKAASRFAKATMELGGKSANIIFADADYQRALDGAIIAAFANNGQACLAGSRILVERKIADQFISDFVRRTEAIRVGRPFDPGAEMGPQSSLAQMQRVLSYADRAKHDGAEILTGGIRHDGYPEGCYILPTVALAPDNRVAICQEEIFGPFATFVVFDDEDEAVFMSNDTRFGLAAYVWSADLIRARRVAAQIRSGYVLVNTPMMRDRNAPFGGFGDSGIDREGGRWSLDFFSEPKTILTHSGRTYFDTLGKGTKST